MNKLYTLFLGALMCLSSLVKAQTPNDYRSNIVSGNWNVVANWQRFDGSAWVAATVFPTNANANIITIRSGHTINVTAALAVDQVVIDAGGTMSWNTGVLTVAAGAGVDLTVNGTFIDNSTSSVAFAGTWELGANGTYIKQRTGSSANWRDNYNGGMSTIPATSNWIIRKNSASIPTFTTVGGTYYGNLSIENLTATAWIMSGTSIFTGNSDFPRIKGNFDIGGTGSTAAIDFLNSNTNASPLLVIGNMIVKSGNNYRNFGTGTEIQGNLTINGSTAYDTDDSRRWIFSGANAQSISGTGIFNVFQLLVNKSANDVTLNKAVTIDNNLILTSGKIISTAVNLLTIANPASVTVTSPGTNNSFVSGPIRKINTSSGFNFPVGKGNNYQPLNVNGHAGGSAINIYTENFNSGAPGWTLNVVTGTEGAQANFWLIDDNEGGVLPPGCGVGNNGNPTLHVTSTFNPTGGAAYDAGGLCGIFNCPQADRRCESPLIVCSGRSGIFVGFNYIEGGSTTLDNATLWYFDGTVWAQLDDMPKTATGCGGQGIWTNRQVALPASADNNPNVRIAFRWVNNDDAAGTDPSFAVDDVSLFIPAPLDIFTCEYFSANPVSTFGSAKEATIGTIVSNEYWILDRNAGNFNKHVTLNLDATSSVSDAANSKVVRWDGAIWRDHANGGNTGVNAIDPTCTTQSTCGSMTSGLIVSSFSPFTFAIPTLLPVTLKSFEAVKIGSKAELTWETASEENLAYFQLERSIDGVNFELLKTVEGTGSRIHAANYQEMDLAPFIGNNYYRLKSVDNDGSFSYSNIRVLYFEKSEEGIVIMPNPVSDILSIQLPQSFKELRIDVYAVDGRLVCQEVLQGNKEEFDMHMIPAGLYLIRITADGVSKTFKIEKR